MKISKQDALNWFRFFAELPPEEPLGCRQTEIALAVFSQIETAVDARRLETLKSIPGLKAVVPGHPTLHYIPYYAWDNREAGPMNVWVDWVE